MAKKFFIETWKEIHNNFSLNLFFKFQFILASGHIIWVLILIGNYKSIRIK
jgi:hypothetical protein